MAEHSTASWLSLVVVLAVAPGTVVDADVRARGGRRDDVSAGWNAATAASDATSAAPVAVAVGRDVRIPE